MDKKVGLIPPHRHCYVCGSSIGTEDVFCSDACEKRFKSTRRTQRLVLIVLVVVVVIIFGMI
ncbi:MAG: DUF2116 family Zn-ribbon domain-containing protein [Halobacteriota archaeon]|nr:DUF2116 family Zn-ribbon domain-containing protein [Halobacteriota archaeon]